MYLKEVAKTEMGNKEVFKAFGSVCFSVAYKVI
jgi:hypothetical protein